MFRTLDCLEPEAFVKVCWLYEMIMHIQSPGMFRTVYSSIFKDIRHIMDIDAYSATLTDRKWDLPCSFWNPEKCSDFGKNGPDCVHLRIKFTIYNVVLRVFKTKTSKMFLCGASCFWRNVYQSALLLQSLQPPTPTPTPPPALKNLWLCTCVQTLFFLQNALS